MRVLVVTRSAWNTGNSLGNTLENLFQNFLDIDFISLQLRSGCSYTKIPSKIIYPSGINFEVVSNPNLTDENVKASTRSAGYNSESQLNLLEYVVNKSRGRNSSLMFWLEYYFFNNFIKRRSLEKIIVESDVDAIFFPAIKCLFSHRFFQHLKVKLNIPLISYHLDDYMFLSSTKLKSYETKLREAVLKTILMSDENYVISNAQSSAYEEITDRKFNVLTKTFSEGLINERLDLLRTLSEERESVNSDRKLRIVYAGSLHYGRLATLIEFCKKLRMFGKAYVVDVFSQYDISLEDVCEMKKLGIRFRGSVPFEQLKVYMNDYECFLHLESFEAEYIAETGLSFSTKVVELMSELGCIIAVGPETSPAIRLLKDSGSGFVITDLSKDENVRSLHRSLSDFQERVRISFNAKIHLKEFFSKEKADNLLKSNIISVAERYSL